MGIISDQLGRRTIIIMMSTVHIISSFVTAFSTNYWMFICVRFFVGGSIHAAWASFFVLMAEIVPEKNRTFCGGVLNFGWNIGSIIMTLMAYFIRDWQHLQLTFAVTSLFLVSYFFAVPESPRWLLSKGKSEKAKEILLQLAKRNGIKLDQQDFQKNFDVLQRKERIILESKCSETIYERFLKLKKLLSCKEYLRRLCLMIFPWFAVGQA